MRVPIKVPEPFLPLLQPMRYKGAYGGRGGAKSHFFANYGAARTFAGGVRMVCLREVQQTLKDSVKQLIENKIGEHGWGRYFDILEPEIRGPENSLIIFRGMQSFNADNIKSLEDFDIAWIEEAQTFSERSWRLLRPTIRKPNSEIWASWNPRFRTDPIDKFFRKRERPNAVVVRVGLEDNPWASPELLAERAADYEDDPEMAEHVWGGGYEISHGAILARLVERAERDGRIGGHVVHDVNGPGVEISSDIGFRDTATWWFWQRRIGGFSVLDYDRDSGLDASEWIARLQKRLDDRGWPLGKIWLPHDARNRTFNSRHTAMEQFLRAFGGDKISIVPDTKIPDRINAGRTILRKTEFNATNCSVGLDGLRAWEYEWNPETGTYSRTPLHNWASHDGDGFTYGCIVMQSLPVPKEEPKPENMRGVERITVNELMDLTKPKEAWA